MTLYKKRGESVCHSSLYLLFDTLDLSPLPDIQSLRDFLFHAAIAENATMYDGICRIPDGFSFDARGDVVRRWEPAKIAIDHTLDFETASVRFRTLFEEAIRRVLPDNETIACQLSGGFDSSTTYAVAKKFTDHVIPVSLLFDDPTCDEREYIELVLEKHPSSDAFQADCSKLDYKNLYNMEWNYSLSPHWPIWVTFTMMAPMLEFTRQKGIRTVLTGQMGDHLLYGSDATIENYLHRGELRTFTKEFMGLKNKKRWLKGQVLSLLTDKQKKIIKKMIGKEMENKSSLLTYEAPKPSFTNYADKHSFIWKGQKQFVDNVSSAHYLMYRDSSFSRGVEDKYGIRFVSPYADRDLMEFLLSVPPEYRYSLGNPRHLHGEAMKDLLPEQILNRRKKAEFSIVVRQQIDALDREALWQKPTICAMGLIDRESILRHEAAYQAGELKGYDSQRYWRMINIEYWYAYNPYLDKSKYPVNPAIEDAVT